MTRLFFPSLLALAISLGTPSLALAQDFASPAIPSPSAELPVMHCMYDGDTKLMPPNAPVACGASAENLTRHTISDLLKAGWRITHYTPMVWHQQVRHYFILEAK